MAVHKYIVDRLIDAIQKPDYHPPLPVLNERKWDKVLNWELHNARNNFFEWMGDSLFSAALSVELCRRVPEGNEHVFTVVRGALASNMVFAHVVHKLGVSRKLVHSAHSWYKRLSISSKQFSDLFEVIVAEVYRTHGFETLCVWIGDVFSPLIPVAVNELQSLPTNLQINRKKMKLKLKQLSSKRRIGMSSFTRKHYQNTPQKRVFREPLYRRITSPGTHLSIRLPKPKAQGDREMPIMIEAEASSGQENMELETSICSLAERGSSSNPICISDSDSNDDEPSR